jgi:hypothetical protein
MKDIHRQLSSCILKEGGFQLGYYVSSSYEADIVKPLMYFFSCSGCHGLADPAGASLKRKIPRGSGNRVPRFRLTKKTNNNTPFKINAKLDASIFSRTVLKERFPPEA